MNTNDKIELLSALPVKDLDDLRLIVSGFGFGFEPTKAVKDWADLLNQALEYKQAQHLKGYDDEQMTFI
jgi:hypothetical protein